MLKSSAVEYLRIRDKLDALVEELEQIIRDAESWMQNNPESTPMDIERWRLDLQNARQAAAHWRAGETVKAGEYLDQVSDQ